MINRDKSMWQSRLLADVDGIVHGFSTRLGGVSEPPFDSLNLGYQTEDDPGRIAANRTRFLHHLGLSLEQVVVGEQVHGRGVAFVTRSDRGKGALDRHSTVPGVDALMTADRGVGLFGLFADCVPIFAVSEDQSDESAKRPPRGQSRNNIVALAHAGWRGTLAGIVVVVLQSFKKQGVGPEHVKFALGPCIQRCCFEVSSDVADQFETVMGPDIVQEGNNGRITIDLPAANQRWLTQAGVPPGRIETSLLCTSCRADLFFSHRRDAGRTGRMAAFIAIHP